MNMVWERLSVAKQHEGLASADLSTVAYAARVALFHTVIDGESLRRRLSDVRVLGRDPRATIAVDIAAPERILDEEKLLQAMIESVGRFVDQPLYDDTLTRCSEQGSQYRSRIIVPEEVDVLNDYAAAFGGYASAVVSKDYELAEKCEGALFEIASTPRPLPPPLTSLCLVGVALGAAAYLDTFYQSAQPFGAPPPLLSPLF